MSRAWTSREKYRAGVWAVAVSAVVFVGSLTGAQLKADRQKQEVRPRAISLLCPVAR